MIFDERTPDRVVLRAPAKLNLFLEVLGKREDGYHELETVFHAIDVCDVLTVERRDGSGLDLSVEIDPVLGDATLGAGHSNLVDRAHQAYEAAARVSGVRRVPGLRANLRKTIPMGAGLGGGSSDAGAMLAALDHFTDVSIGPADLAVIAAAVGSDVPFFLIGGTAIGRGRGELLEALPPERCPTLHFVVHHPGVPVSTATVYANLSCDLTRSKRSVGQFVESLGTRELAVTPGFHNALSAPFRSAFPELAGIQDQISEATGHPFTITGSGSAMFTTVEDPDEGARVVEQVRTVSSGTSFVCRSLAAGSDG